METIGKYRIIGELGKGGFGQVYKAEDPTIGSVVAIKVLNVQNDEAMLRRFRAEAVTSAKLRHKNIVTIFDFEEQNGTPYLVMEYLDGENLQRLLETKERVPILEKLSIMAEVAEGLQYAHEHGVIHRDIKPANIMRLRDGSVKIMDFGIARLTQRNTRLTAVGYLVGTPEYMAPEQFMSEGTDSQCDVWSYGVVLYEFLTGHNPFSADSPGAVIYKVTHEDPPSICERVRELPNSLDPVMRRLLAKKKAERYPSMEDLLLDLGPVIQEFGESQVAGMEKSAEGLIRAGRYDEALAVAARILKFDQKNTRARKWRADLRDLSRRQKEEARIKVLIEEADQKTTLLDFFAAEARLKEALQIDPANTEARTRLDRLNVVREKKLRAQNLLAEARVEFGQQNLTSAFEHAAEAAQADPANADATEFARQVRKAIEKRDSEARRKAGLSKSRSMLLVQDYAGAVNTLQELEKQYPGDSEVRARLDEALHLQAVDATEKKAAAAIAKSRDYLVKGAFQDAIDLLSGLDPDAGRNVQVLQLLSYVRDLREHQKREAEVERLLATATASQGDYDRALGSIDRALELSPGNEKALRLRKAVLANRQRDDENKAIGGELEECRSLMSTDRLEHAETRARALWKRHPDHPGVQQIIRDLGERFRQREEAIEREIESRKAELERLLDRGDVEAAADLLKTLSARYQRDNLFADLSRRIARMETEKREQEAVNAILARAQRLGDGGYWDDARLAIDLGLKQFPKSGALLAQRERVLQQAELQTMVNEIQRQIALEDWESVVSAAESGLRKFPGDGRLTELLQTAREEREWKELLLRTESLIVAGDLEEADKTIAELARRGRDNASVVRLLRMLGDKRQRQQSLASADHFRKRFAFQQARDVLETILKEDPNDAAARALQEAVDREQSAYTRGQNVAAARAEAGRLSKQKEYAAAVRILTDIANAYPGDFEIEEDLRHAIEALDQAILREAYSRGRNELAALVRNREFDQALQKAEELIARFPDDSELRDELRRVREARDQAIRKQAYEEGRTEVAALMKNREFDRAIGRLQELAAAFPEEPEVEDELRRARATREQAARKAEYARGRKELEELVRNRDFDRAVSAAERLSTAFPEEPELQDDLRRARAARDQAQRKNAYTRRREGFDALMADRQFDLAVNAVEGLSRDFPEESELRELLRHAREARDQARRKEAYSRGCQDFEVLLREGKFEQAVTAAQHLIAAFPEEESSELLRRARKAREEAERKEKYARACQDFEVLMRDGKFDQAVAAAQQLIAAFPEEESSELLRRAREVREEAERKEKYARACQDFEVLMRDGKFDQAVTAAQQLMTAFPKAAEPPELSRRAREAREEAERKEKYARGRQDFEVLMRDRKFDQAVTAAQQLIKTFPEEQESAELLRDAQSARDLAGRKDAYSRGRQDFEALMRERQFDQAVTAVRQLIDAFPEEQESAELLRRAEKAHDEAARKEAYKRGCQDFEILMGEGKFDQAATAARQLIEAFPEEQESAELLRRAGKARDEAARKEAYKRGCQDFEVLMSGDKFEQAVTAAQGLMAAFPKEPEAPRFLRRAQDARDEAARKEAYQRGCQNFEALMRDREFEQAITAAQQLIEDFPGESESAELLHRAQDARNAAYKRDHQAFEALMRDGRFEQAVTAAQTLTAAFPKEPEAAKLLRRAQDARDEAARKEAYRRDRQVFEALMRDGKFEQAVTAAQALTAAFPKEPEAAELLRRAQDARAEAARKEAYQRDRQAFEVLIRDGKFEQAVTAAERFTAAYPKESEAKELLRRAQDARKNAYKRDYQAFEALMRDGKFEQAVTTAQALIAAFPKEPAAAELLRRAQDARDEAARREAYNRDRQAFEALMREGKFEQAVTAAQAFTAAFPKEPEAAELLRRAQDARDEAARKEAYQRDRQVFEALMREGKFEQAVTAAQALTAAFPKESESPELLRRAEEAARKEAYQRDHQVFEVLMRDGKFEQAVTAAERLTAAYPEKSEVPELARRAREARDEAARKEAFKRERQAFDVLMRDGKFEQAVAAAERLTAAYPEESEMPELACRAREARDEAARKAAYDRGRQEFEALLANAQLDQAIAQAQELIAAFPAEPGATKDLERARAAQAAAARKAAFDRGHKEFDTLMGKRQFDRAIAKAQELATVFPEETILKDDLKRAVEAREQARRQQIYEPGRKEFDALLKSGRLEEAIHKAEALIKEFPEDAVVQQDLQSARAALEARQREAELDRQATETVRRARQLRQQRAVTEALELVQKAIQDLGNRPDLRELQEQLLADQARTRLARQTLDKARDAVEQGQIEAAEKLATDLGTNLSGEVDTRELRAAIAAKAEELRVRAAIEGLAREAENLRSQARFDEALQSLDAALQQYPGTQVLIAARERVEKDRQAALRKQAREQALSEISALPQSVQGAPDEPALREIVARAEAIAAGYPGDKLFKQAAQALNKAAKRRRTEFARVPGVTAAPPEAAPLWKRPIAVAGIAASVLIGATGIWWLAGSRSVALQISTDPAGAKVTVGSVSCTTPQCALRLAPGNYDIRAEKPGYRAGSTTATIGKGAPAPVTLTLVPLPARLSVGANFTKATIAFDGSQLGQLRNGEFALDSVPEGTHTLDIHSSDGQAALRFEYKAGQPPKVLAPPSGKQIQAVVVSGYASTAEVQCDCASGEVTLDGKSAGQLQNHRLALTSLAAGTHQLRVSAPDGIRESVVSLQDSPSINLYVAADLDVGTLVVEAGQDGVQVLLDNRPQPTLTHDGIVRIPVPSKQYSVSVAKPGFRAPAAKSIEVKKGQLQRVSFELVPLESTLEVRAGSSGVRVQIDGQSAGTTGSDGSLRVDNVKPGSHTIDLTKDGYTPLHLTNFKFEPGATVSLGREAQLAALPTPTPAQPNPPAVTPTPTPDPRALEAEEWNRLQNSQDINKLLDFIGKHPGDAYSTQAAARVEQIEWDNLQNNADPKAWEAFVNKYPKSDRADPARKRAEQMEWSRVDKQNTGQIRAFLQHHPANPDATAALAAAEQAERLAADKRAISQVLTQYQQAFTGKNIDGMLALRPSLKGTPKEKTIRDAFHQKQSIVLELAPLREAEISGDSAVVQCRQTTQNQQGGDKVPAAVTVTITLSRTGQSWIIKDIE